MPSLNLDELSDKIFDEKRRALKPVVSEVLKTFESANVPLSEFLSVLSGVVFDRAAGDSLWNGCITAIDKAAYEAEKIEAAVRFVDEL